MVRQARQLPCINFQIHEPYFNQEGGGADYAQPLPLPHLKLITPLIFFLRNLPICFELTK